MILLKSAKCSGGVKPVICWGSQERHMIWTPMTSIQFGIHTHSPQPKLCEWPGKSTTPRSLPLHLFPLFSGNLLVGSTKSYRPLGKNVLTVSSFFSCYGIHIHPSLFLLYPFIRAPHLPSQSPWSPHSILYSLFPWVLSWSL